MKKLPTLYDKASTGKIKMWSIGTAGNVIVTTHGYIDGKQTTTKKTIHQGKNIGKKNETTPDEQAYKEARSKWQKKVDKGSVSDPRLIGSKPTYHPMLAKTYYPSWHEDVLSGKRRSTQLPLRVYVQPKLNGVRCIAVKKDGCVKLYSRGNKDYTPVLWDLARELNLLMDNDDILDGELFKEHWNFERIVSAVKRERDDSYRIEFWCYDKLYCGLNRSFDRRETWLALQRMCTKCRLKVVDTHFVGMPSYAQDGTLERTVKYFHDKWVKSGFEGIIIRDAEAKYKWKYRSNALLKYKEFIDEEFQIVGYRQGSGNDDGAIIFKCHTTGIRNIGDIGYFDVRPIGEVEDRKEMFRRGWDYIGKMLTVRFQERSSRNVPIFPIGITIRDYE